MPNHDQMRPPVPEALRERMHSVLRPKIVVVVDTAIEIRVVVDQIVGAVGDEQAQGKYGPSQEIKGLSLAAQVLPGQQATNQPRVQRDRTHGRPCRNEPLREQVQGVPLSLAVHLD